MDFISGIVNFFANFPWEGLFSVARVVIIVLDILLFVAFGVALWEGWKFRPNLEMDFRGRTKEREKKVFPVDRVRVRSYWDKIKKDAVSAPPHSMKLGVIAADNLVDSVLQTMGLPGEHMAERLQKLDLEELETIEDLWRAHKIRNQLVHTPGFEISKKEGEEMLETYEAFLRELEALE